MNLTSLVVTLTIFNIAMYAIPNVVGNIGGLPIPSYGQNNAAFGAFNQFWKQFSYLLSGAGCSNGVSGTATSGTTTTLTDTSQNWAQNQWAGGTVQITAGTDSGLGTKTIVSNTANTLTISSANPWPAPPDTTSQYTVQTSSISSVSPSTNLSCSNNVLSQILNIFWNTVLTFGYFLWAVVWIVPFFFSVAFYPCLWITTMFGGNCNPATSGVQGGFNFNDPGTFFGIMYSLVFLILLVYFIGVVVTGRYVFDIP
jgi:hypothetical protein